jgi:HEAT repeat protein
MIYSAWALGALGDAAAVPELVRVAAFEDAGIRKAAVHALGSLDHPEATTALRAALTDAVDDVRWNAALGLGRRGDPAAVGVLLEMLDRERLSRLQVKAPDGRSERLPPEQLEAALLQGIAAAGHLPDPALRAALASLHRADPSLKVREAARVALGS